MIQAAAFLATCAQLDAFRRGDLRNGWRICLVCCVLWGWAAWELGSPMLGLQQLIFAGIATRALMKR